MTRRHHLETTLRALELSGMRETVEARLIQVRAGELGHLESFQVLCEDEIARREAAALGAPGPSGPLRTERHHQEFDFYYSPNIPAAAILDPVVVAMSANGREARREAPVRVRTSRPTDRHDPVPSAPVTDPYAAFPGLTTDRPSDGAAHHD